MKESDVAFFGSLLNETEENVKSFAEEGTLGEKVSALGLMNKSQVDTLKENYAKEVKSSYLVELTEAAKKGELPQDLYKPIHGAVLEKTEKALSKKFDIADYTGVDDLVDKAIGKHKGQSDDKRLQESETLIEQLRGENKKLLIEKEEAVTKARSDFESQILNRDMSDYISKVPFDFSDVEADKMDEVKAIRSRTLKSVFEATYSPELVDGKIVVKDKQGDVVKTQATLEPVPVSDVLQGLAKELGIKLISPESGGQGGKSSGKNGQRFANMDEFNAHLRENNILATSAEGLKLYKESGLKPY